MGLDHWLTRGTLDQERENVCAWRKENWLHNWFYVHCGHGIDPEAQAPIPVRKADVEALRDTIKDVLEYGKDLLGDELMNLCYYVPDEVSDDGVIIFDGKRGLNPEKRKLNKKEQELCEYCEAHLPAQSGFFFGSTDYDKWYFEALEVELKELNAALEKWDDTKQYWYECWW